MSPTSTDPSRTAVFTGTFDPLTLGHLDVIRRGRLLFEHLVVGIGVNPNKASLFTIEERVELARQVVAPFPNVSVESFEGLTVQFVRRIGARVILRGLRTLSDMEYEFGMTLTNHRLDPDDRDRLPDGRRRVLARLQHADQAGRPVRRRRGAQAIRPRGADRADHRQDRRGRAADRRETVERSLSEAPRSLPVPGDEEVARPLPHAQAAGLDRSCRTLRAFQRPVEAGVAEPAARTGRRRCATAT